MENICILIVEDEQRLAEILKKQLEESGFRADVALDGYSGKMMAARNCYSLIILDINLPLLNGYDLCKEIRKTNKRIPIIMLTAFGTADNKIIGFDSGADDYVVKPFDFRELLARINVFLRRSDLREEEDIVRIADLEIDVASKTVSRSKKKIDLTAKEFALLEVFVRNRDKLLSREFIIEQVWGIDFDPSTNIIDVYVNYLRKKIDKDFDPKLIHTKFGFGFYFSDKEI
ncbi:MAG: response regulator transcription factor [Bacteroidales bacterium]|jgi:DNA-binding response OmpR family regulator|nr:response regulator transcription factor [Bacteroidales bacterium]MCU0409374.1 response regulator transcription factor [Bacteroidales bacterium]